MGVGTISGWGGDGFGLGPWRRKAGAPADRSRPTPRIAARLGRGSGHLWTRALLLTSESCDGELPIENTVASVRGNFGGRGAIRLMLRTLDDFSLKVRASGRSCHSLAAHRRYQVGWFAMPPTADGKQPDKPDEETLLFKGNRVGFLAGSTPHSALLLRASFSLCKRNPTTPSSPVRELPRAPASAHGLRGGAALRGRRQDPAPLPK